MLPPTRFAISFPTAVSCVATPEDFPVGAIAEMEGGRGGVEATAAANAADDAAFGV